MQDYHVYWKGVRTGPFDASSILAMYERGDISEMHALYKGDQLVNLESVCEIAEKHQEADVTPQVTTETPHLNKILLAQQPKQGGAFSNTSNPEGYPARPAARNLPQNASNKVLIVSGYVCAVTSVFLLPLGFAVAALVAGIILTAKGRVFNGIAVIVLTVICGSVGVYLTLPKPAQTGSAEIERIDLPGIHLATFPAVVHVYTFDHDNVPLRSGTGFSIEGGYIVTNFHVIKDYEKIRFRFSDATDSFSVQTVAIDEKRDIAVLKSDRMPPKSLHLVSDKVISVGERVAVIGSPKGFAGTLSDGIVSAHRTDNSGIQFIQITAPISQGSSGSPVVNSMGEVVGIATMVFVGGQNLNFAVTSQEIDKVMKDIIVKTP